MNSQSKAKNKTIIFFIVAITLYFSLMTVFAFYDLNISIALYDKESIFAKVFETIAEVPFNFLALTSFTILFLTRKKEKTFLNIFLMIIYIIGMLAYGFLIVFFVLNYLKIKNAWIYGLSFTIPIDLITYFSLLPLSKKEGENLKRIAIIAVLTILIEQAIINVLKYSWGRPRMRDLINPQSDFRPWYLPNWFKQGDSFPSGHSANASCIIAFTLLPEIFSKKNKKLKVIISSILCYAWIITVMISRIIQGAHFASDVLTGATITLITFYFLRYKLIDKKQV